MTRRRNLALLVLIALLLPMPIAYASPRDGLYDEGDRVHGARHAGAIDAGPMVFSAPAATLEEVTPGGSQPPLPVARLPFHRRAPPLH